MSHRILHIIRKFRWASGTATVTANVLNGLDRSRFQPYLCVFDPEEPFAAGYPDLRVPVVEASMRRGGEAFHRWDVGFLLHLCRAVRRHRIELVHAQCLEGLWYGAALKALCGVRLVHTEHAPLGLHAARPSRGTTRRWLAAIADASTCVSHTQGMAICRLFGLSSELLSVVYNGVDCRRFGPAMADRSRARAELGIGENVPVVGSTSKLVEWKNYPLMIRAFARLRAARPDCMLVIAGDGPLRGELEELSRQLGVSDGVRFLGARSDVPKLMRAFDVLALTSIVESFGCVLAEAAASGTPVVTTRAECASEVVADGETGIIVSDETPQAIAEAWLALLSDPQQRQAMGRAARERAESELSVEKMVRCYERIYDECLAGRRQHGAARLFPLMSDTAT